MVAQYGRPLLPKMHYVNPIPVMNIDWLRHQTMQIVAARLQRAELPLRRGGRVHIGCGLPYVESQEKQSKFPPHNVSSFSGYSCLQVVQQYLLLKKANHNMSGILVCYPELILPTIFLYLFVIGIWNYQFRPRHPPYIDARLSQADNANSDELDEEFDSFPTSSPSDIVQMRYDRLRSVAGRVQTVVRDMASQSERAQAILRWRDQRATAIFIILLLIWAMFIYVTPFQVVAILFGLYWLRHPRFRSKLPPVPVNLFKRLPSKSDMLI